MAINRRKGSVPEKILTSELFRSGEYFTTAEMASSLGTTRGSVTAACATLRALGLLTTTPDKFHRRIICMNICKTPIRKTRFEWEKTAFGPREWSR